MNARGPLLTPTEKTQDGMPPMRANHTMTHGTQNLSRFEVLKQRVRSWWEGREQVGAALIEIRDHKLYRMEFETFEEFCEHEFGFKRAHAYRLIEFAKVKASVAGSPIGDKITNESQARALATVPEENRVELLTQAAKSGPVTAKRITEAAEKNGHKAKTEKIIDLDKTGYPIPETILEEWNRAVAFKETINQLSQIKLEVETGIEEHDPIFREITNSTVSSLTNAYRDLKRVLPYAVCTSCQGLTPKKCSLCKGRGFLSQFTYSTCIPEQTKKMRERKK